MTIKCIAITKVLKIVSENYKADVSFGYFDDHYFILVKKKTGTTGYVPKSSIYIWVSLGKSLINLPEPQFPPPWIEGIDFMTSKIVPGSKIPNLLRNSLKKKKKH